eukprot:TRINITY_DN45775_c0_g1_i1.p1 TRINITY_DN45775_c0_g1~~TRINITY_DN45775_c0_g1_i1.p1  ORF type:complete len:369 (-),score=36.59 TRINITY_DN45775_c0_g1_i1:204-1310(-)
MASTSTTRASSFADALRNFSQFFRKKTPIVTPSPASAENTGTSHEATSSGQTDEHVDVISDCTASNADVNWSDCCQFPIFSVCQCVVCILLWLVFAARDVLSGHTDGPFLEAMGGLESLFRGRTMMRSHNDCDDQRAQVWRMLTYQFTHLGFQHLILNCVMLCVVGGLLECRHGARRVILMFNIGVFGGACCSPVFDAHSPMVGMSGGVYALIGAWVGDFLMNRSPPHRRFSELTFLVTMISADFLQVIFFFSDRTSYAAHLGSYVAGACASICFGKSFKVNRCKRILQGTTSVVATVLIISCFLWSNLQWPPRNLWSSSGYCWLRQVYNSSRSSWVCIWCGDLECVAGYAQEKEIHTVDEKFCGPLG